MTISWRMARLSDADFILDLRNEPVSRKYSRQEKEIPQEEHYFWFRSRLLNLDREPIYIFSEAGLDFGYSRLDEINALEGQFEISLVVDLKMQGRGFGANLIDLTISTAAKQMTILKIIAFVNFENLPSLRVFQKTGFFEESRTNDFVKLSKTISEQLAN